MDKLPIFEAFIGDEQDGVLVMSLVESPATEFNWLMFSNERETVKFSFDEEQRILKGVVMLADTPIYRRNGDYEYYIKYSKETLKAMAQKMLNDHTFNTLDTEHSHNMLGNGDAELRELFIKDVENGINPKGFEDVTDGSLLCTYYIANDDIWQRAKNGEFKGFSLEGIFSVKEAETYNKQNNKKENKMSKLQQLKQLLSEILVDFSTIKLADGTEVEVGSQELQMGVAVKAEDGQYELEDGRTMTVKDGIVSKMMEKEENVIEDVNSESDGNGDSDNSDNADEQVPEEVIEEEGELEVTEEGIVEVEQKEEEITEEPKEEVEMAVVEEEEDEVVEEVVVEPQESQEGVKQEAEIKELKGEVSQLGARVDAMASLIEDIRGMVQEYIAKPAAEPIVDSYEPHHFSDNYNKWELDKWISRKR